MANSVLPVKRKQAILRMLENDWDVDGTIAWMLKEFADDPAIASAKNKEKLCRNILTLGGSGLNQHVNILAFQQALDEYSETLRLREEARLNARLDEAVKDRERYREQAADAEARARAANDEVRDLERKLNASERQVLRHELAAAPATV